VLLGSMLRAVGDAAMGQQTVMTQLAQGRMVPTLQRGGSARVPGRPQTESYVVRWIAAVVDRERIRQLSARMPGPVRAFTPAAGAARLCRGVLNAAVDAICRAGVVRLVTAAVPPVARSRRDVAEAVLAGLAGEVFAAARGPATEVANDLRRWAAPVVGDGDVGLIVRLEPPDADGGWLLTVDATGLARHPLPVERAVTASGAKARRVNAQLRRLERLVPALGRTGRRGQAVLGVDAAWEFMTRTGRVLQSAGFDVRVPAAWRARPLPRLRLEAASPVGPARVGPHQHSRTRWSVLFDDLELDAAAIARLTAQARPLVRTRGRWVELDRADLEAAARALAERSGSTSLPRRPHPGDPRPHDPGVPGGHRSGCAGAVDQGRRIGPRPHGRQPRGALRPVVEGRGRGRQAPHRRSGAPGPQLGG
jgi:hypothetical protein